MKIQMEVSTVIQLTMVPFIQPMGMVLNPRLTKGNLVDLILQFQVLTAALGLILRLKDNIIPLDRTSVLSSPINTAVPQNPASYSPTTYGHKKFTMGLASRIKQFW